MRTYFYGTAFLGFLLYLLYTEPLRLYPMCLVAATARTVLLGVVLTPFELIWQWAADRRRERVSGS